MSHRLGIAIAVAGALMPPGCIVEKWTTPGDELKVLLGYYANINRLEQEQRQIRGTYVDLADLSRSDHGNGDFQVRSECEGSYCSQISRQYNGYQLRIVPHGDALASQRHRRMSLYADQTGLIHVSYGFPLADEHSPTLSSEELRRFTP